MFKSIRIRDSFLPNNMTIKFEKGLNVIQGKNGIGKSCVLEYLSYALYGTIALRSPLKDFSPDFYVEAIFEVDGLDYKVIRKVKGATLFFPDDHGEWTPIVKGTTPVNSRIKEILGYDYNTYSLINFCKQHDLLSLTNSTPAQLLSLIEYVSGLTDSYRLENELKLRRKEVSVQEGALKSSIDVALNTLNDVFTPNEEFDALLEIEDDPIQTMRNTIKRYLEQQDGYKEYLYQLETLSESFYKVDSEVKVYGKYRDVNIDELQESLTQITVLETEIKGLERSVKGVKEPSIEYDESFLETQEEVNRVYDRWSAEKRLRDSLERHRATCPNCNHSFYTTNEDIKWEFDVEPEEPSLSISDIKRHREWNAKKEEYSNTLLVIKKKEEALSKLDASSIKASIEGAMKYLSLLKNREGIQQSITSHPMYVNDSIKESIGILNDKIQEINTAYLELESTKDEFVAYLKEKLEHEKRKEIRATFGKRLRRVSANKNLYKVLTDVLKASKNTVQSTILPKLNSVASRVMSAVTYGKRTKVEVTDEFKLFVDGQAVDTLEGSAQVLTNIALRCALMLTFYSDVFLVSLQDESDAALSEDRFQALVEAYRSLTEQGFQLITISHKEYDYGNIINIEEPKYYD